MCITYNIHRSCFFYEENRSLPLFTILCTMLCCFVIGKSNYPLRRIDLRKSEKRKRERTAALLYYIKSMSK